MIYGAHQKFYDRIREYLPERSLFTDPLRTLTYGTDASFYRMVPRIVVRVENGEQVRHVIREASRLNLPLTFRAAGTSLSGQAISDSILVLSSRDWNEIEIEDEGKAVRLSPSVIGAQANGALLPFGRKIGPDPASISAAMIGGIAANNASGMCCGVADNSYQTLLSMKVILADGSRLDSGDEKSRERFRRENSDMLRRIGELAKRVRNDEKLRRKIQRKFKIKNTCGYSLNALVDFEDPIEILTHLMIGSEGTLGFIEEIRYRTVPEYAHKASALMIFPGIREACDAVRTLKTRCSETVDAAELMDRAALRSVEEQEGMPPFLSDLPGESAALLVETRAPDPDTLQRNVEGILSELEAHPGLLPHRFTDDAEEYGRYWKIRKGLFPAVGAVRQAGTTVIIEDVAYPIDSLADATLELQRLFAKYGYDEAIIFGHALEGNLHFVFTQSFDEPAEIHRYEAFMEEIVDQVAQRYRGSLKAEHGTGRNMAPFVEREWGEDAYRLMWEIKEIFDPRGLLNPGVVLNRDPRAHLKHFKAMPPADPLVDRCTECGFCEPTCPSNALTLTPRQRIVAYRALSDLRAQGAEEEYRELADLYRYDGEETCATCQLCSTTCPIGIDTGALTKKLRAEGHGSFSRKVAWQVAEHYSGVLQAARLGLRAAKALGEIAPEGSLETMSRGAEALLNTRLPKWMESLPGGISFHPRTHLYGAKEKVVYFSSCINRSMGNPKEEEGEAPLYQVFIELLERAGFQVILPESIDGLCCGMPFSSKGYAEQGRALSDRLEEALRIASGNGRHPIVCDMSPCSKTMSQNFGGRLKVYDSVEFADRFLLDRLEITPVEEPVILHSTCSTRVSGLAEALERVARACSTRVIVPENVGCCGFAGDRGFTHPELNRSALRHLPSQIPEGTRLAFSSSKTCEIGLTEQSGLAYRSILYLLERCSRKEETR